LVATNLQRGAVADEGDHEMVFRKSNVLSEKGLVLE